MKQVLAVLCILVVLVFMGCESKSKPLPLSTQYSYYDEKIEDNSVVEIPYKENGGVKFIKASINGLGVEMIFDTGCSGMLISIDEVNYLVAKGLIDETDMLGTTNSVIADGSIVENMVVMIRELVIGDIITCRDVEALVSSNSEAPLLLGNAVVDRAQSCEIDNRERVIRFKLR